MLDAIASAPPGAVLFHCGAGWDRTGLVAAVLRRAVGATEQAAVDDYLASFSNASAMAALHGRSFEVDERHDVLRRFGHTAESAFREMYRGLELESWLVAHVDTHVARAVTTWRGALRADSELR